MENEIVVLKARNTILTLKKLIPDVDLEEAISKAITEYCGTPDGNMFYQKNGYKINYSDFKKYVPNNICEKYGFLKIEETRIKNSDNLSRFHVTNNMLTKGAYACVKGEVKYSRILSPIDDWELYQDKIRREFRGLSPIMHPYYTITIKNATIIPGREDGYLTLEDQFVMERLYLLPRLYEKDGAHYTINTLNKTIPHVGIMHNGKIINNIPSEEPYKNTPVFLMLKVVPCKLIGKTIELDSVIICETEKQNSNIA